MVAAVLHLTSKGHILVLGVAKIDSMQTCCESNDDIHLSIRIYPMARATFPLSSQPSCEFQAKVLPKMHDKTCNPF